MKKTIEQIMTENNIHNQLSIEQLLLTDWKKQFDQTQLKELRLGLEKGIDVSIYAKPEFTWKQMNEIRFGLEDRLDVTNYATSEFKDWRQMRQIRLGLEQRVDVTNYAKSELNWEEMKEVRLQLLKESTEK